MSRKRDAELDLAEEETSLKLQKQDRVCADDDCNKEAMFGPPDGMARQYCGSHKKEGMVNISRINEAKLSQEDLKQRQPSMFCREPKCYVRPTYGPAGTRERQYCKPHAKPGMRNTAQKNCCSPGCERQPQCSDPGVRPATHCSDHKLPGMERTYKRQCATKGCKVEACYNFPDTRPPISCKTHMLNGMVNVKSRVCAKPGCKKQPTYNKDGETIGLYCSGHAELTMVDVHNRRCAASGCSTVPNFNFSGEGRGLYCKQHMEENMVCVTRKLCQAPKCSISASRNYDGEREPLFCATHAEDDMIDINAPKCAELGCSVRPAYNFTRGQSGLYCVTHKLPGMVDVHYKPCIFDGCITRPSYGPPGLPPVHCVSHTDPGDVVHPGHRCEEKDCKRPATYGIRKPERCDVHHEPLDRDFVRRRCSACLQPALWDVADGEMCDDCGNRFVNTKLRRQRQVKAFLDQQKGLPKYDYNDKAILRAEKCGLEKPDFAWQLPTYWLFLEVDEYQHAGRPCECEQMRMVNVTQGTTMPCVWIRYNPDDYRGRRSTLRDRDRQDYLGRVLYQLLRLPPITSGTEMLRVCHLFFDDYNMDDGVKLVNLPTL